ncbi:MAG: aminopeptidase P family protein [Parvibaculaceae bacterium]
MFQVFEEQSDGKAAARRLDMLRAGFDANGIDGYIVPRSDEFQGEYVAPYAERLRWLTGFTGSAGLVIILRDKAAIFVDGRYTIQVREQVDTDRIEPRHLMDEPPARWIEDNLKPGSVLGYDPWLLTAEQTANFAAACGKAGGILKPLDLNLVDAVWKGRPSRPSAPVSVHPTQFAGRPAADKVADMAKALEKAGADAAVLTLPDSVAWLLNIRGEDVSHVPVALAFAILHRSDKPELFIDAARLSEDTSAHLARVARLLPPDAMEASLAALGVKGASVIVDPHTAAEKVRAVLADTGAKIVTGSDPCVLPKARKNATEVEGARAAHRRDGAAMSRFLAWFDREAPKGGLDEIATVKRLEEIRSESGELRDVSFDSIAGAGPHAAIPHYHVSTATNRAIGMHEIFLMDSGGQYPDGTTDVTRTVIVGTPTAEMKDRFTRVLKGMIGLSRLRFPPRTMGGHLDAFARHALWQAGLDFDHGTGHGVGSYLSVHEGPARFSKADRTVLEPGMILSNEPGYYKQGHFGIRIENLVVVREAEPIEGGERPMRSLETLTLVPIDRRLIEPSLLSTEEREWLDAYHARVRREIGPSLEGEDLAWLEAATAPL